eukprot:gb/GFBE01021832.1/.p1 GENE.gb/GFBE01021832.1/~~gb/GFBE01021832.1/.p1  ORF type:complete len:211 (+),score=19.74 gb/GFBE01021832.1/:1-633(+)
MQVSCHLVNALPAVPWPALISDVLGMARRVSPRFLARPPSIRSFSDSTAMAPRGAVPGSLQEEDVESAGKPVQKEASNALAELARIGRRSDEEQRYMRKAAHEGKSLKCRPRSQADEQFLSKGQKARLAIQRMLTDQRFDAAIGGIILLNSITIGLESSFELKNWDLTVFGILEHVFLIVYVTELALRFYAQVSDFSTGRVAVLFVFSGA